MCSFNFILLLRIINKRENSERNQSREKEGIVFFFLLSHLKDNTLKEEKKTCYYQYLGFCILFLYFSSVLFLAGGSY